jgi:beta-glucanase (GH16 family)
MRGILGARGILWMFVVATCAAAPPAAPSGSAATGPTLLFDDEFNADDVSSNGSATTWMTHYAFANAETLLTVNGEWGVYGRPGGATVSDGNLLLTATKGCNRYGTGYNSGAVISATERFELPPPGFFGYQYGHLGISTPLPHSRNSSPGFWLMPYGMPAPGLFAHQYGYYEARMLLPKGRGLWPAFWLMPADGGYGEIDIMEALGSDTGTIYVTLHPGTQHVVPVSDFSKAWHIYAVNWQSDFVTWFVDGKQVDRQPTSIDQKKPYYILLNLAVGGPRSWPGAPDSSTVFPAQVRVDYVRVYSQRPMRTSP